jgi:selenide,water dikinase
LRVGAAASRHLVLIGGGHAHVQVLRALAMRPVPRTRVTLVVDRPVAMYSGMVPALLAGEIPRHDVEIDVRPLARRAGVDVIVAAATRVDPGDGRVELDGRPPLRFDLASLDVGSTVVGHDRADVGAHALPTRPIVDLVERWEATLAALPRGRRLSVVVVGGGAAGVEVCATVEARLRKEGWEVEATLVGARGPTPERPAVARVIRRAFAGRGLRILEGRTVAEVRADTVVLDDGSALPASLVLWVTGAAPSPLLAASPLPLDDRGFVWVRDTLQVRGHDHLLAAGDCAVLETAPWVPRAGVYAVRAGPVLVENLAALCGGGALRSWRPQRDFLALLNLGDGTAIASRGPFALRGAWAWRWKDRIDRQFMERFQRLLPDDSLRPGHDTMDDDAPCGGCAGKVGPEALGRVLGAVMAPDDADVVLGVGAREDVASVRLGGAEVVASVDGFRAFCGDDWLVGHVAARNATSDLHAKGVRPRFALVWVTVPEGGAEDRLGQVMAGVRAALDDEGVVVVGGQSGLGPEVTVGLTVLGSGPVRWGQTGARPGDALILTRALGTGALWRADMLGLCRGAWMESAIVGQRRGNATAAAVLAGFEVVACTDVTGFGLAGHLAGLMEASGCAAVVRAAELPLLPGVAGLLARGMRSTAHAANSARVGVSVAPGADPIGVAAAYDPQTGGGLLVVVRPEVAGAVVAALRAAGEAAVEVGAVAPRRVAWVELT